MRLFIYEYTCGSSLRDHAELAALRDEGRAMLAAVLTDAARLPALELVTLWDPSCGLELPAGVQPHWLQSDGEESAFRAEAAAADWTWVIAPETDEILATRCRWVEAAGSRSLNCSGAALALAGDKLALGQAWLAGGLPAPEVWSWPAPLPSDRYPMIWKPRFGAGSQATFLVQNAEELARAPELARAEGFAGPAIVQTWAPGQAASVAWLVGPRAKVPLLPAWQLLSTDGRFHYQGGELPLPADLAARAVRLSRAGLEGVPGLLGFVGVDLILGDEADGSQDRLIEINPRLTTSYLGLRALAQFNLVQAILDIALGSPAPELSWADGPVRFSAFSASGR